jgi:hypothetical protein
MTLTALPKIASLLKHQRKASADQLEMQDHPD